MATLNRDEDFDYRDSKQWRSQFEQLTSEIKRWITNVPIVSYGAIGRRFRSEYSSDLIESVIQSLANEGFIKWDSYKPAPQMIKLNTEPVIRREINTLGFNNQTREEFYAMIESRTKKVKKSKAAISAL